MGMMSKRLTRWGLHDGKSVMQMTICVARCLSLKSSYTVGGGGDDLPLSRKSAEPGDRVLKWSMANCPICVLTQGYAAANKERAPFCFKEVSSIAVFISMINNNEIGHT